MLPSRSILPREHQLGQGTKSRLLIRRPGPPRTLIGRELEMPGCDWWRIRHVTGARPIRDEEWREWSRGSAIKSPTIWLPSTETKALQRNLI